MANGDTKQIHRLIQQFDTKQLPPLPHAVHTSSPSRGPVPRLPLGVISSSAWEDPTTCMNSEVRNTACCESTQTSQLSCLKANEQSAERAWEELLTLETGRSQTTRSLGSDASEIEKMEAAVPVELEAAESLEPDCPMPNGICPPSSARSSVSQTITHLHVQALNMHSHQLSVQAQMIAELQAQVRMVTAQNEAISRKVAGEQTPLASARSDSSQQVIAELQAQVRKLKAEKSAIHQEAPPQSARSEASQHIIAELQAQVEKLKDENTLLGQRACQVSPYSVTETRGESSTDLSPTDNRGQSSTVSRAQAPTDDGVQSPKDNRSKSSTDDGGQSSKDDSTPPALYLPPLRVYTAGSGRLVQGSYDASKAYYPSTSGRKTGPKLILNLCKRSGTPRVENTPVGICILYEVIAENSPANDLIAMLERALPPVYNILDKGGDVLVHCNEGLIRSPTFVAIYLAIMCGEDADTSCKRCTLPGGGMMDAARQLLKPNRLPELCSKLGGRVRIHAWMGRKDSLSLLESDESDSDGEESSTRDHH
eukprot:gnl/MRDRNA2_/MRDRNA2_80230_c0_seq1.p1 gnl/MRDRNA2_/MRDRNA2_80230_c0~~gnl/MRDRNA2_/MRDRNA2_80230_c0_seq1.p1  ORF type:complete len:573 (+),score=96.96 gnl/MRDRNA2_/MRDRNA2_80230_c0_seq1:107-1720(+)